MKDELVNDTKYIEKILSRLPKRLFLKVTIDLEHFKTFRAYHHIDFEGGRSMGFNTRSWSLKDIVEEYILWECGEEALPYFKDLPTAQLEEIMNRLRPLSLLPKNKLKDFKKWCDQNDIPYRSTERHLFKVLQVCTEVSGWMNIYRRSDTLNHYYVEDELMPIVQNFLDSQKRGNKP